MRPTLFAAIVVLIAAGATCSALEDGQPPKAAQVAQQPAASADASPARAPDQETAALDEIAATATAYEEAYNKRDAKAIAALFTDNGEMIDEDGFVTSGREAIESRSAQVFEAFPRATIRIEVESIRLVGTGAAVEEGRALVTMEPDTEQIGSRYTALHVLRDGKWLVASVRDTAEPPTITPHQRLEPLSWLVGDWIDESDESLVETSCRWSDDGNYLIQKFHIRLQGGPEMRGEQRIGWDPLRGQVRSWAFDSQGGFIEAYWTQLGDEWLLKANGVSSEGITGSATRILTPVNSDSVLVQTVHRVLGGESAPDVSVLMVRKPPEPEGS